MNKLLIESLSNPRVARKILNLSIYWTTLIRDYKCKETIFIFRRKNPFYTNIKNIINWKNSYKNITKNIHNFLSDFSMTFSTYSRLLCHHLIMRSSFHNRCRRHPTRSAVWAAATAVLNMRIQLRHHAQVQDLLPWLMAPYSYVCAMEYGGHTKYYIRTAASA